MYLGSLGRYKVRSNVCTMSSGRRRNALIDSAGLLGKLHQVACAARISWSGTTIIACNCVASVLCMLHLLLAVAQAVAYLPKGEPRCGAPRSSNKGPLKTCCIVASS